MSAGVLQVKRLVLMTDEGKPAGMLSTIGGSSGLVLLDSKGEVRVLLSADGKSGHISLSGEGQQQSTNIHNGALTFGDDKTGGIEIEGPPLGGPVIKVFDNSGYSTQLGRALTANHTDGTISMSSAAALTASSKDRTTSWSLLSQPVFAPAPAPSKRTYATTKTAR